jgi:hypothetical protein
VSNLVTDEVQALEGMSLEQLRNAWRSRFGAPPRLRSPGLLRFQLAWRIQAEHFGGLDTETRRLLRAAPTKAGRPHGQVGDRFVREWQGVPHEVEMTDAGFRYRKRIYKSLSQVARVITGVRWNGPRFFGLRKTD